MGRARAGYVLIGVLAALSVCVALAGTYALSSRRALTLARVEVERAQAEGLARGACIQAVKDLTSVLGRADPSALAGRPAARRRAASTQIEGLPEFPAEMAAAGGFLGVIAERLNAIQQQGAEEARRRGRAERPADAPVEEEIAGAGAGPQEAAAALPLVRTGEARIPLEGVAVEVFIESESGKVDLNLAPRRLFRDVLLAVGVSPEGAEALTASVEAYRLSRATEARESLQGAGVGAGDAPMLGRSMERVEELLDVPGFTAELYESLVSHVTVHGHSTVDPNYASEATLLALGVGDAATARALREEQSARRRITAASMRAAVGLARWRGMEDLVAFDLPPTFTVRSRAVVGESVSRYVMRIGLSAEGRPTLLESRENWL